MYKKTVIPMMAVGLLISGMSITSLANGPMYDDQGNLILDTPQEPYKDLSTAPVLDGQDEVFDYVRPSTAVESIPVAPQQETRQATLTPVEQAPTVVSPQQEPIEVIPQQAAIPQTASVPSPPVTVSSLTDVNDPAYVPGYISSIEAIFKVDETTSMVATGNKPITKVEATVGTGLLDNAWTISGSQIIFNPEKLNSSAQGIYSLNVTFVDNVTFNYKLTIVGKRLPDDYWKGNINSYNMNPQSSRNIDFEMISAAEQITVHQLYANDTKLTPSDYTVVGNTIVVSKAFLNSLGVNEYVRFNLLYNKGQYADLILSIKNEAVSGGGLSPEDC